MCYKLTKLDRIVGKRVARMLRRLSIKLFRPWTIQGFKYDFDGEGVSHVTYVDCTRWGGARTVRKLREEYPLPNWSWHLVLERRVR